MKLPRWIFGNREPISRRELLTKVMSPLSISHMPASWLDVVPDVTTEQFGIFILHYKKKALYFDGPTPENLSVSDLIKAIVIHEKSVKYIHLIDKTPTGGYEDDWFNGLGWYFADETECLNGPYCTQQLAIRASHEYCNEFLGTKT